MMNDEKEKLVNPQHIVINTLRAKLVKFNEELLSLSGRLGGLEKTLEKRAGELSLRIEEIERQISGLKEYIGHLDDKNMELEGKFSEVNDFLKETKIKLGIFKKCLIFMKEFPGHVVAFLGAITAIVMYLLKFFGL